MNRSRSAGATRAGRNAGIVLIAALGLGGPGCGLHDALVRRDGHAVRPFGAETDRAHGLSPTMGTDLSELKPGERAPDPVPGSDLL